MDKNLHDIEKMFEEIDFDFLDDIMSDVDDQEVKEEMKRLLEELENEDSDE